jgi:hypothetical protein
MAIAGRGVTNVPQASTPGSPAPPPGWWQASDGKWYPPEQHPAYIAPVPQELPTFGTYSAPDSKSSGPSNGGKQKKRKGAILWITVATVVVIAVVVGAVLATSRGSKPTGHGASSAPSARAGPSASTLLAAAHQFGLALAAETSASQAAVANSATVTADITKQNQRLQQDENTYDSNVAASGCMFTDPAYESCAQSEEQMATNAQSDEAAATAQIQADEQQYSSGAATLETALSTFIGQVVTISWPSQLNSAAGVLVTAARQYRNDVADQAAVSPSTPTATLQAIQAQAGQDVGNLNDAISAVKSELLQLASSVQGQS